MIRVPEVTVSEGSPDHASLVSRINAFPSCQVSYHVSESDAALQALASDAAALAAAEQNIMFQPRLGPDVNIGMKDGKGGEVDMSGFKTAPSHRMGVGGVGNSYTAIHEASLMGAYAPHIYTAEVERRDDINPQGKDLATRAVTMLEALTKAWQGEGRDRGLDVYEEIKDSIHSNNQVIYPLVKGLLDASVESTEIDGLDAISTHSGLNLGVNSAILKALLAPRTDFFANLMNLAAQWQLIYQPSKESGNPGKLIRMQDVVDGDGEEKEIAVKDFVINAGPMSIMPVTGVLVEGVPSGERRSGGDADDTTKYGVTPGSVVFHGEASGRVATAPLPPFLMRPIHPALLTDGTDLTQSGYESSQEQQVSDLDDITSGPVKKLCEQWAKNHYTDLVLAPSNAVLTCELDLSWNAGQSYQVSATAEDGGGGILFRGLLNTEEHTISTRGQSPVAETRLSFSHVLVLNNSLPDG